MGSKKDFFISGSVYDGIDAIYYTIHLDLDPDTADFNLLLEKTVTEVSLKILERIDTYKQMREKNDTITEREDADIIGEYWQ